MSHATVLVAEDDPNLREALCETLELAGYQVEEASDGKAALEIMERKPIGMVVSDVQMRPMDGHELMTKVKSIYPSTPVLLMTAYGNIEKAVSAMRDGAVDYLAKPFEAGMLVEKVSKAVLKLGKDATNEGVVAEDKKSLKLLELARRVATSDVTVMIGGESGTGKEVYAQYIHRNSNRSDGPFIAINCAAIPDNMLEAVLFGYEKGAYTGAHNSAPGKFEQAQGGTLLLDEISEMSLNLQAKLLRVLQEKEVERLGGRKVIPLDVRVLATSNRKLREEVAAGRFREDLFFRLNVFPLYLEPLRNRPEDILPLARTFLNRHCVKQGLTCKDFDADAEKILQSHPWPGNARELDNVMQRALILSGGSKIGADDLTFGEEPGSIQLDTDANRGGRLNDDLRSVEEQMILDALRDGDGSRKQAAERLGISQRTLRYKIAKLRDAGVEIPG